MASGVEMCVPLPFRLALFAHALCLSKGGGCGCTRNIREVYTVHELSMVTDHWTHGCQPAIPTHQTVIVEVMFKEERLPMYTSVVVCRGCWVVTSTGEIDRGNMSYSFQEFLASFGLHLCLHVAF